jgi:hypothetical protein
VKKLKKTFFFTTPPLGRVFFGYLGPAYGDLGYEIFSHTVEALCFIKNGH